eukprot:9756843-Alexandrium_andersonii.AAC.1
MCIRDRDCVDRPLRALPTVGPPLLDHGLDEAVRPTERLASRLLGHLGRLVAERERQAGRPGRA